MIICRSPLRISLGGGGTDLPSYYKENEGFVISAAINHYVYVTINRPFKDGIFLKYSEIENVKKASDIKHKIIREALLLENLKIPKLEITTLADIPSGTGLGSSGSFTTALIKALYAHRKHHIYHSDLAQLACKIELDLLKEPIGKQDQYISAYGGITCFDFNKDGNVTVSPLKVDINTIYDLEDNLLLFFTGFTRSASDILKDQNDKTETNNINMLNNLHYVKNLGIKIKTALENGDTQLFGEYMHEHWENKKKRSPGMSNSQIDGYYQYGLKNGAVGGKIVGAGGGGFLMFMANDRNKLRHAMNKIGLSELRFSFDFEGSKLVLSS